MSNEIITTCFTDLQGSTAQTEKLGHKGFIPFQKKFLNDGKEIAIKFGGK